MKCLSTLVILGCFFLSSLVRATVTVNIDSPPTGTSPVLSPASGNDSGNDYQHFADALTYISNNGGGTLVLGNHTYRVCVGDGNTTNLAVSSGITIQGSGSSVVHVDTAGTPSSFHELFHIVGNNVTLTNFTISNATHLFCEGVVISSVSGFTLTGMTIDGAMVSGSPEFDAIKFEGDGTSYAISNTTITASEIKNCLYGTWMYGNSASDGTPSPVSNTVISNSYFHNNWSDDVNCNGPEAGWTGIVVQNCSFADNQRLGAGGGFGVDLANCRGNSTYSLTIKQCHFTNYQREAIHLEDRTSNFTITQNMIANCGIQDSSLGAIEIVDTVSSGTLSYNYVDIRSYVQRHCAIALDSGTDGTGTVGSPVGLTFDHNTFLLGWTACGIDAYSSKNHNFTNNVFQGYGTLDGSGNFVGGVNFGIYSANALNDFATSITGNTFSGLAFPLSDTPTWNAGVFPAYGNGTSYATTVTSNTATYCRYPISSSFGVHPADALYANSVSWGTNTNTSIASSGAESTQVAWIDDASPLYRWGNDASPNNDGWNWLTTTDPLTSTPFVAFSNSKSHDSAAPSGGGQHGHYTLWDPTSMTVGSTSGQTLTTWALVDPNTTVAELMVGFTTGTTFYYAYWGADSIANSNRLYMGPIPQANGGWIQLTVAPSALGFTSGQAITGTDFEVYGGHVTWDRTGLFPTPSDVAPGFTTAPGSGGPTSLVGGFAGTQNVTGQQCVRQSPTPSLGGTCPIYVSGTPTSNSAYAYANGFSVGGDVKIDADTKVSYWIYPTTPNGRYVGLDFGCGTAGFYSGPSLRGANAVDLCGFGMHPNAAHGGAIPLNEWTHIICNIGQIPGAVSYFNNLPITQIWIGYDQPSNDGTAYGAYIDDIVITDGNP